MKYQQTGKERERDREAETETESEILKETTSQNMLNDVINGRNDPLYKILLSIDG